MLLKCRAIKEDNGIYKATAIGTVASLFYFSPFDVADLRRNFKDVFDGGYEDNDLRVAMALANVENARAGIISNAEKKDMAGFKSMVQKAYGRFQFKDPEIKFGYAYYCLMNGIHGGSISGVSKTLQWDAPRMIQVLQAIDQMNCKWNKKDWFKTLSLRINYGVKPHLLSLCGIANIGKVRAEKLWKAGIKNAKDVSSNQGKVQSILNMKKESIDKICQSAKDIT